MMCMSLPNCLPINTGAITFNLIIWPKNISKRRVCLTKCIGLLNKPFIKIMINIKIMIDSS